MADVTVQYRVVLGKKEERVEGPDDALVVISVPIADAGRDPSVAFMAGKLKASGPTGALFELLKSGEVARMIGQLAGS